MSYVVSTASKSPFVKPKKSIHSENPFLQWFNYFSLLTIVFTKRLLSLLSHGKIHSASLRGRTLAGSFPAPHPQSPPKSQRDSGFLQLNPGCCTPPPEPPRELEGSRIPLVESRVLSPTPRAPQSARGILDSFNRIPGAVPRPQGTPESQRDSGFLQLNTGCCPPPPPPQRARGIPDSFS